MGTVPPVYGSLAGQANNDLLSTVTPFGTPVIWTVPFTVPGALYTTL